MKLTKELIAEWRKPPEGFFKWLNEVKPMIPSSRGGFEAFEATDDQVEFFNQALSVDEHGDFRFQTIVHSAPRRHSKTVCMSLLVIWRFFLFASQTIIILGNSTTQAVGVSYKTTKSIILNTGFLREQLGSANIQQSKIQFPQMQSVIEPVSCQISSLYGRKISIGWCTELHAASDGGEAAQVLASSIGDTKNSWFLVDSSRDPVDGALHQLEKAAPEDETLYFHLVEYRNLDEALEKSPHWISRKWLKSRQKQLLPATFNSQHLNLRGQAENSLFQKDDVKKCLARIKNPTSYNEFLKISGGNKFVVGGGLDRAFALSKHGDRTVWTTVAKLQNNDEADPEFYVLHAKNIFGSIGSSIKKAIKEDFEEYGHTNIALESYNAGDIFHWCVESGYPTELITPTAPIQTNAFLDLSNIVSEGRLHFPDSLKQLEKELLFFEYKMNKSGYFTFGAKRKKDDFVYSLTWSIYSLRKQELSPFELDSIACFSKSRHSSFCYLRNGDLILSCSNTCQAHIKVQQMFNKFRARNVESDLSLPQFFERRVKLVGTKSYQSI